jgi:hypothetical protein
MKKSNLHHCITDIEEALNAGFSCVFVNGVSFTEKEEKYTEILKDTYNYKPELYEDAFRFYGSLNKSIFFDP